MQHDTESASAVDHSPIRIAVVGCGAWGRNHVRGLMARGDCEVIAVEHHSERLAAVVADYPQLVALTDHAQVFGDPDVSAVVIATPAATHFELVRAALRSGKHVLCEKPLCLSRDQADELARLARNGDRQLLVGHVYLFHPGLMLLRNRIDAGELGSVHYATSVREHLGPVRSDVNVVFDLVVHDVAIFNWLLADVPELVTAVGECYLQPGIHDVAAVTLQYPQRRLVQVRASWLSPRKSRQITVVGTNAMATWDEQAADSQLTWQRLEVEQPVAAVHGTMSGPRPRVLSTETPAVENAEPLRRLHVAFLDAIRIGRCGESNAEFSRDVVRVLEAVQRSLLAGGAPTPVV